MNPLESSIAGFKPISLKEMDAVALMNRTDTKYLASKQEVLAVLDFLSDKYRVLQIADKRLFEYRTIYFDTSDKNLLYQHLRGKLNRVKVRAREYVGTTSRFFEVKHKSNKGNTIKSRIPKSDNLRVIEGKEAEFLSSVSELDAESLQPVVEINFKRITLVSLEYNERITFDFQLTFSGKKEPKTVEDLVIVEMKRDASSAARTPIMKALKRQGIYPSSMSKYCLGMILMDETQRYNKYKPKLLKLNKLSTHGNIW
ncbi:MAG: polyphosphate polymerase domain-containing protein [Flavobacteriales bacterium]